MQGRISRVAGMFAASVLLLAGCSANPKQDGNEVTNAKEALEQAEKEFRNIYPASTDLVTIAEDAKCFFEKKGKESITEMIHCGPLKELDQAGHWVRVRSFGEAAQKKLELTEFTLVDLADPTGELFRPDGAKPGNPDDLAEPLGPSTTAKDFAVFVPLNSVPALELKPLETPTTLKQPAVTATVAATATLDRIPPQVISVVEQADGATVSFRPAEGQQLGAWQIDVSKPVDLAPSAATESTWGSPAVGREAGAGFHVEAGGKRLTVRRSPESQSGWGSKQDNGDLRYSCDQVPCSGPESGSYLLIVSAATVDGATLVATTDGQTEALPLAGGAVTTDHSTIHYDLDSPSIDGGMSYTEKTFTAVTAAERADESEKEDINITYGFKVSRAYLSPFQIENGWAPTGEAWLVLELQDWKLRSKSNIEQKYLDVPKTWSVTADGTTYQAVDTKLSNQVSFKVPATARSFQMTAAPHVSLHWQAIKGIRVENQVKEVTAPEPITLELTFS